MSKNYIIAIVDAPPKYILEEDLRKKFTIPKETVVFEFFRFGSVYGIPTDGSEVNWINPSGRMEKY
jgi:hypothetical protein